MLADKKKKLIVLAACAVAVLGVGAFMFSRPQATPAPAPKSTKHDSGAKPEQLSSAPTDGKAVTGQAGGSVVAEATPQAGGGRDPFDGTRYEPLPKNPPQSAPQTVKPFNPLPGTHPLADAQRRAVSGLKPSDIEIGNDGSLPNPDTIAAKLGAQDGFKYSLIGVITGIHPAVVFSTPDFKNQRLVQLNGFLGPDTRVTGVTRGKATVYNHGQELKMTVGADNPTEKHDK